MVGNEGCGNGIASHEASRCCPVSRFGQVFSSIARRYCERFGAQVGVLGQQRDALSGSGAGYLPIA